MQSEWSLSYTVLNWYSSDFIEGLALELLFLKVKVSANLGLRGCQCASTLTLIGLLRP